MDSIKNFFDSFKEFIWDIIGYLIPGSYILILLSICIKSNYYLTPSLGNGTTNLYPYVFVIVAYLLGHVAYGFGLLKEEVLGKYSYVKQIEANVSTRQAFDLAKQLISKGLLAKGITNDLSKATVRDVRNLAMSFIPEQDQKIYSFTFRSDLANQTGNISIVIGGIGLLFSIFKCIPLSLFRTDVNYIMLYVCLIPTYYFLRQTRNRFYAISVGLPFSIYTAKAIKP
jgi:hypothetical protein